jgi:predicted anti-sigma-YlaC factor YlaD
MRCERYHELISARLDGEASGPAGELDLHLAGCTACRAWETDAESLHRALRLHTAPDVPDLTDAILAGRPLPAPPRPGPRVLARPLAAARRRLADLPPQAALRAILAVVATTQLVLAAPQLLIRSGDHVLGARHLGGWDVAFALGLLVVAAQPWRVRGLLPMATAVAGVMVITVSVDVLSGVSPGMAGAPHLLEVCGVAVLWALSRATRADGGGGGRELLRPWRGPGRMPVRLWPGELLRAAQRSAAPSWRAGSPAVASSRITPSRALATRERTVPTGQPHTDAVSA